MTNALLAQLRAALDVLAMPPERQLEHARQLGVGNDELALEFDDVGPARTLLVKDGLLSGEQAASVAAVERQLSRISSAGPSRWTNAALLSGEDWEELRRLAQSASHALGP